jgi:hypothetical protein
MKNKNWGSFSMKRFKKKFISYITCHLFLALVFFVQDFSFSQTNSDSSNTSHNVNIFKNKLTDEQWLKSIGHLLIIPFEDDQMQILSNQLNFDDQQKSNFANLNELIKKRDGYGNEEMRAQEMEVRTYGHIIPSTKSKYDAKYNDENYKCLELAKTIRSQLGSKDMDLVNWLLEENYIHSSVWKMASRKELDDESTASTQIIKNLEGSDFFKSYQEEKSKEFSNPVDRDGFFHNHGSYLEKRIAYHILSFKSSEYQKQNRWNEFLDKKKEIVQETSIIGQ